MYYKLNHARDIQIKGHSPQIVDIDSLLFRPLKKEAGIIHWKDRNIHPYLYGLIMHSRAKHTDYLECDFITPLKGFLFSDKMVRHMRHFHLPKYKTVEATFVQNNELIKGYQFLYFLDNVNDFIDYEKSKFMIEILCQENYNISSSIQAPFKDRESYEYFQFNNSHRTKEGDIVRITLTECIMKHNHEYDLMVLSNFGTKGLVSEGLKDTLENSFSGVEFEIFETIKLKERTPVLKEVIKKNVLFDRGGLSKTDLPEDVIFIDHEGAELEIPPTVEALNSEFILVVTNKGSTVAVKIPANYRIDLENKNKRLELFFEEYVDKVIKSND